LSTLNTNDKALWGIKPHARDQIATTN